MWKRDSPEDNIKFHPYAAYSDEETYPQEQDSSDDEEDGEEVVMTSTKGLLFVHQTKEQRRLLKLYGNELRMLDATHKTTKYSLPLFFVVVKTNVDYQIVGSFVVQSEMSEAISEVLSVLKS